MRRQGTNLNTSVAGWCLHQVLCDRRFSAAVPPCDSPHISVAGHDSVRFPFTSLQVGCGASDSGLGWGSGWFCMGLVLGPRLTGLLGWTLLVANGRSTEGSKACGLG